MESSSRIEKLKEMSDSVRIGGKGSARRKKKIVHKSQKNDGRKLQTTLKKLGVSTIPSIEEANMFREDGTVIHFNNPKVQASLQANTFTVSGQADNKKITEILPSVLDQLGPENFQNLKKLASSLVENGNIGGDGTAITDDEEVPDLVENFDEESKGE